MIFFIFVIKLIMKYLYKYNNIRIKPFEISNTYNKSNHIILLFLIVLSYKY